MEKQAKVSNINKKIRNSPLVRVDKSEGPGHHKFSLIGSPHKKVEHNETEAKSGDYSETDLENDWKEKRKIGAEGEKFVRAYLKNEKAKDKIKDFQYVSEKKVNANHDFKVIDINGHETYIEVKSTKNNFDDNIYISYGELLKAKNVETYLIYRVYKMNGANAKLRISENIKEHAKEIIDAFNESDVLADITPTSLSFSPLTIVDFVEEEILSRQ